MGGFSRERRACQVENCRRIGLALALAALVGCAANAPEPEAGPVVAANVPAEASAEFARAVAAMKAGQWSDAETRLLALTRNQAGLSGAHFNLALIYARSNRPQDAEAQFRKALAINPKNADAQDQFGVWLRTQGRFKEAETAYLAALQQQPGRADTHLNLGILYDLYLGRPAQALEHYQKYVAVKGDGDAEAGRVKNWIADLQRRVGKA